MNEINIVVAPSFARIFRQNMFNCGMIAAELNGPTIDRLFEEFAGKETTLSVDLEKNQLHFVAGKTERQVPFILKDFEAALVRSGGWVQLAAQRY
jgi:3-isopropylmalate/(R)-2-methylmalate dehydratase small subunit